MHTAAILNWKGWNYLQDEGVPGVEPELVQFHQRLSVDLPWEKVTAEGGEWDPGDAVDHSDYWDDEEEHPPEPEDEEVLLIKEVVAEDAEEVCTVEGAGGRADVDVAGNLGGEQLAHGVVHGTVFHN